MLIYKHLRKKHHKGAKMECENIIAYSIIALPILFFISLILLVLKRGKGIKTANAKHYLIYKDIYRFDSEYLKPIIKKVPKLLELGLLKEEDLYIDLTGGDDTMGVSDYYLILLRIEQNCSNAEINSNGSNLIPPYHFKGVKYNDKTGKWVYYRDFFTLDPDYGWTHFIDFWKTRKYGIFKSGFMYNDKGSGNRVSKEWRDKLKKLVDVYNSYMESVKNDKINEIDLKFKELESK